MSKYFAVKSFLPQLKTAGSLALKFITQNFCCEKCKDVLPALYSLS